MKQTRLMENFGFAITDPNFNPVCVDAQRRFRRPVDRLNPSHCAGLGFSANPNLVPGLIPFDLTRGGSLFNFHGAGNVNQYAVYVQDAITVGIPVQCRFAR